MKCCVDFCEYLNESSNSSARLVDFEVRTIEESLRTDVGTGNGAAYKIKQLFNKHGYNLSIMPGHVRGKEQNMQLNICKCDKAVVLDLFGKLPFFKK